MQRVAECADGEMYPSDPQIRIITSLCRTLSRTGNLLVCSLRQGDPLSKGRVQGPEWCCNSTMEAFHETSCIASRTALRRAKAYRVPTTAVDHAQVRHVAHHLAPTGVSRRQGGLERNLPLRREARGGERLSVSGKPWARRMGGAKRNPSNPSRFGPRAARFTSSRRLRPACARFCPG